MVSEKTWIENYEQWLRSPALTSAEKAELRAMSEEERYERFWTPLNFGTAGIRGLRGLGTARINIYTVRRVTQALADIINQEGGAYRGVVIARDSRIDGEVFAREAACVLAANGVRAMLFEQPSPTPELSFAVRSIGAIAGINITASHNPSDYSGCKVYWSDGAQFNQHMTARLAGETAKRDFFDVGSMDFERAKLDGLIRMLGHDVDEQFLNITLKQCRNARVVRQARGMTVVFTPLYGTGARLIPEALKRLGVSRVICVDEQMAMDGSFPGLREPNPEKPESFEKALRLARSFSAGLVIGADPDGDRLGVWARHRGEYKLLTGNQLGALLTDYVLRTLKMRSELPENGCILKSVVSTELAREVAAAYGMETVDTFTGFRYIAERIAELEYNHRYTPLFSFEESFGCMLGSYLRDKDAVGASAVAVEMAAFWLGEDMTLVDALEELYKKHGYFIEDTCDYYAEGAEGAGRIREVMESLRADPPGEIAGLKVTKTRDYLTGRDSDGRALPVLGEDNMLYFELEGDSAYIVRPSGTEPKLRSYMMARGDSRDECARRVEQMKKHELFA